MNEEKNVLLISYYWPPSGGAGVHRWLRFSKYFKKNNVNLTVYCPTNAAWPVTDDELMKQIPADITVIRRKIFEPHKYFGGKNTSGVGFTQAKKANAFKRLIIWIRGNLFIPDSRVFWIKPSIRYLSEYLKNHAEIDIIISTGPPHSTHLIACELKKRHKLKWLADFRDPWTQIDFYQELLPGKRANAKQERLEKMCLSEADEVITVSESCAIGLEKIANRPIQVITNGYDFPIFDERQIQLDDKFSIAHFGSLPNTRNPEVLWSVLGDLISENENFKNKLEIKLVGTVDYQIINSAEKQGLAPFMKVSASVKHSESIALQRKAQLLLLVANNTGNVKGILTGKFFEYLGAKRPIIAIGAAEGDLAKAMQETDSGCFIDFNDNKRLKEFILDSFEKYVNHHLVCSAKNTAQFSSEQLAQKYIELIQ